MSTTTQPPKPKRRWYQFSLMTLLIVVTLFTVTAGCFGGWVQYMRNRAQENRERVAAVDEAVAAIEEFGWITSEYENLRPQTWLERQFDDPGSADDPTGVLKVSSVMFWNASDTDVEHLKGLNSLQSVDLSKTEITDAGLEHLKGLTKLRYLDLTSTDVTDVGLMHLKGLTELRSLFLHGAKITDAGLKHLKGLTKLQRLALDFTNVTGEGVKKLQQALPNCKISPPFVQQGRSWGVGIGHQPEKPPHPRRPAVALARGGRDNAAMSSTTQSPKSKRRWCQFSLKTLLIVVTLATVGFGGWVQYMRQRAQENRDRVAAVEAAVAAIQELGGEVTFEYEDDLRPRTWLETQFDDPGGVDDPVGVLKVESVIFWTASDTDLEHLKVLTNLQVLDLYQSQITDAGLEHLKGLRNLQFLNLIFTKVSDAGLEHLSGLTKLQNLHLDSTHITDAGLEHLKVLTNLQRLDPSSNITDVGVEHLKGLTNLRYLDLSSSKITDAAIEHLKGLTLLRNLSLDKTNVTDAGLEHLKGLTNLTHLDLARTKVTDAGLEHLKGLKKLERLDLQFTNVTDEGVEKLQQALPNCAISHDF